MKVMIYQILAILILATFYTFYFAKILIQKKQSIKTNQMGIGNKSKKVILIERIMSVATVLTCIAGICSTFLCAGNYHNEKQLEGGNSGGKDCASYEWHIQMEQESGVCWF